MGIAVFVIISVILSGIIYIIYSVKFAEIADGNLDEQFDEKAFSKPAGWKVGKMPPELQKQTKVALKKIPSQSPGSVVEDLVEKWKEKDLSHVRKSGLQK